MEMMIWGGSSCYASGSEENNARGQTKSDDGNGLEGHPAAVTRVTSRGVAVLDGRDGRQWAIERFFIRSRKSDRSGVTLQRGVLNASSETNSPDSTERTISLAL